GGEAMTCVDDLAIQLMDRLRQLDPALARRWASTYGSRIWKLLDGAHNLSELGEHLGAGLYAREVEYLVHEEWARDADDILWRR
ncbi:glycerol-3-phosphate dehydrogenase, partial [Pseudomonas sp. BAgro211]|nr:glycerol-3-phosphate dehydrogenase [Pseudomonas sp. BAgro211]